jgi:hypothetical protein
MMMVAMPHIIPGWSWWVELLHTRLGGSGRDLIQYAHVKPFFAILRMCVLPPDVGLKNIPSINDASLLRRVGIGADIPSGSGTLKCDESISPDRSVMGAFYSCKALTLLNFTRPQLCQ